MAVLIDNEDRHASNGATFERRSPTTQEVATVAAAASVEDAKAAAKLCAGRVSRLGCALGPTARRSLLLHAADEAREADAQLHRRDAPRDGGDSAVGGLQCHARRKHAS